MAKLAIKLLKAFVSSYVDDQKLSVDSFIETRDNSVGLLDTLGKIYKTSLCRSHLTQVVQTHLLHMIAPTDQ